ncbi:hypothetical protein ZWY2020_011227, partial [Hordeum vulgare]
WIVSQLRGHLRAIVIRHQRMKGNPRTNRCNRKMHLIPEIPGSSSVCECTMKTLPYHIQIIPRRQLALVSLCMKHKVLKNGRKDIQVVSLL